MDRHAARAGGDGPGNPHQQRNRSRNPERNDPEEKLRGASLNSPSNVDATRSLRTQTEIGAQLPPPLAPRQTTPPKQMKMIITYLEEANDLTTGGTRTKSIYEILSNIQHDKILWLALHGVPSRSVAFEMRTEVEKRTQSTPLEIHVIGLCKLIQLTIGEIASGGDSDPDRFVANLMASATQHFDRRTLHRAMEHALLDKREKIGSGRGERQNLRKGHKNDNEKLAALAWWRRRAGGVEPGMDPDAELKLNMPKKFKALAIEGLELEKLKSKIEEKLGYEEGNAEEEKAVMKQRLLEIRQTWKIPKRFENDK